MFVYHSKKNIFGDIYKHIPFNKLFEIPSFPNITLSLFQALLFTSRRCNEEWLISQRLGKSRIASVKVSLSRGWHFFLLVASSLNKQNDHRYLKKFSGELKN